MATGKVSSQEKKDIEKYTKRLIFKFIQVILQSRNGLKANWPSKIFASSTDCFYLSIPDLPEITAVAKDAFGRFPVDVSQPICIEISLRTTEDENMVLEYWWLMRTNKTKPVEVGYRGSSAVYLFYNCVATLLRSLLIATRMTPAYRLSRNQSPTSYCIKHKILFTEPVFHMEDEFKKNLVGTVPSPLGDLGLYVAYKTKLLMHPKKTADLTTDIKDDYFNVEAVTMGAKRNTNDSSDLYPYQHAVAFQTPVCSASQHELSLKLKKAAFGPLVQTGVPNDSEDVPFASLFQCAKASPINSRRKRHDESDESKLDSKLKDGGIEIVVGPSMHHSGESIQSTSSCSSARDITTIKDDFVMVDLKPPFGGRDEDLSQLFRKMIDVPSLSIFEEPAGFSETVSYLEDQLAQFEVMGTEFNDFVKSIDTSDC